MSRLPLCLSTPEFTAIVKSAVDALRQMEELGDHPLPLITRFEKNESILPILSPSDQEQWREIQEARRPQYEKALAVRESLSKIDGRVLALFAWANLDSGPILDFMGGKDFRIIPVVARQLVDLLSKGSLAVPETVEQEMLSSEETIDRQQATGELQESSKPRWDAEQQRFLLDGIAIKEYKRGPAKKQVALLAAFQSEGWPRRIACPFGDPEVRRQTIKDLNDALPHPSVRFRGDGQGGVAWEYEPPENP
jgi:hypothetical protein